MPWPSAPRSGPDEDRDVIVHYLKIHEVLGGRARDEWTVWKGKQQLGAFDNREDASRLACRAAEEEGCRAWMLDEAGYPLKPLECDEDDE
jgi:hypothetical protein